MLIKELEDILILVKDLPRAEQLKCVRALWLKLDEWEQRQQEPRLSDSEWSALRAKRDAAARKRAELQELEESGITIEPRSGVVESFDDKKGYGYISMEDGHRALLHITCLRASGYKRASAGARVEFLAIHRARGWQAFRILSLV